MSRVLPPHPHPEHLRNEAKELLRAHSRGDPAACKTFRLLRRFRDASDEQILAAQVALTEVQFALAMDYGFRGWEDLLRHVESLSPSPDFELQARPGAYLVETQIAGRGGVNRFAYGYCLALRCADVSCDYETIMGDTGLAFILQADSVHTSWGKPVDQLDIGYWPLAHWGALMRLDFVGHTAGVELCSLPHNDDEYRADAKATYYQRFHQRVIDALHAGRCPAVIEHDVWVVVGYDDGEPPLIGQEPCFDGIQRARVANWPWRVILPGQPVEPADRRQADVASLEFAVGLGRDRLDDRIPANKSTGQKSFALWARLLRDPDGWGAHFYHANVVHHLRINRRCAVPYLRSMSQRHTGAAASHLLEAAGLYEEVLEAVSQADTTKQTLGSPEGRETLAALVDRIAEIEVRAVRAMEEALDAMA